MKYSNIKNQKNIVENKKQKNESFKKSIYNKYNFKKFCELKEEKTTRRICKNDLPPEFDEELCDFINLFFRKTINVKNEWEFYIDYENNEIIHCLRGKSTIVSVFINSELMKKDIINPYHIKGTYSAPSCENFEILDHEFEDYEIICSENEYWILKAKGKFPDKWTRDVKKEILEIFNNCETIVGLSNEKISLEELNKLYGNELEIFINNLKSNITLTKKEYG